MERYLLRRQNLIAEATPGLHAARELAELTDEAVRELTRAASSQFKGRFGLAALGGWGSGAMLPSSDLDILVLSDAPEPKLKPFVEALLYPLWDAGLAVGHQVRTPRGQLRAMRDDLASCTAALTGRAIAGDIGWVDSVLADGAADAHRRRRAIMSELLERPRPGSPYLLEPELKEGAGGRRDHDELVWTAAVTSGCVQHTPRALVDAGFATGDEIVLVEDAAEVVATARFELARAGLGSCLTLDAAEMLRNTDVAAVQLALASTALVLSRVRRRTAGSIVRDDLPLTPEEVFALLDAGDAALSALSEAAQSGGLDHLIPGMRDLMTLRRPGIGHVLTVGMHSLRAAVLVETLPADGALARSRAAVEHARTLQVAALAHDVGKRVPGPGHAQRGAEPAREAAVRFGLSPASAQDAADLVALHLLLPETAQRIDLDDEDAILLTAAQLSRRELLAPLHLLTAADSIATGPSTWTRWSAALTSGLVTRLDAALSDEVDGAGIASRGEAVRTEALAAVRARPNDEQAFVRSASLRYLASHRPAEVARDAGLVASLARSGSADDALIAVGAGPTPDSSVVTVVASDRPELLARVAGAMSLAGLDILALDAYGAPGGIALDAFVVASATRRPVTTETFTQLERLVRAALRDRLELRTRLEERRRHYRPRTTAPVRVETVSAGWDTAIQVSAPDRPGLLHDLAQAVSATGLDIRWAKVLTIDGLARDTFHVVGSDGGPVDDPGILGHLAMRLREVRS
jgi:[protein-PII] uridylyltransferase